MSRAFWVWLHRWAGLAMVVFLVIVGLTGSLLAFLNELEHVISPQLFTAPVQGVATLDLAALTERAEDLVPHARVETVSLGEPDQVTVWMSPREDPAAGKPYELGFNQLFLNPWTGEELGV